MPEPTHAWPVLGASPEQWRKRAEWALDQALLWMPPISRNLNGLRFTVRASDQCSDHWQQVDQHIARDEAAGDEGA